MNSYLSFFSKISSNNFSQAEINIIVEKTYIIALTHIKNNYQKYPQIYINNANTFEELAIDSIIPLFQKNVDGEFFILNKLYRDWISKAKSEQEALYFLFKTVANRVEQQSAIFLSEINPFFKKILETVNYYAAKEGHKKQNHFGTVYIANKDFEQSDRRILNVDDFELLPNSLFVNMKFLFANLFEHLENETGYQPAVPLNALVNKLMHLNLASYRERDVIEELHCKFEVDNYINLSYEKTICKLEDSYLKTGKLSFKEIENFKKALFDMAVDLKEGGINCGLYKYLLPHFNNLTREECMQKYHNIIEYMLKFLKNSISEYL